MAKFRPAFKRGKERIVNVTLMLSVMPNIAEVHVDGVVKYRGRSIKKAVKVCDQYTTMMEQQGIER